LGNFLEIYSYIVVVAVVLFMFALSQSEKKRFNDERDLASTQNVTGESHKTLPSLGKRRITAYNRYPVIQFSQK
jgi:hypothetical protein